jgi:hypothetical protein
MVLCIFFTQVKLKFATVCYDGQTPLHYAVTCERESIAEYLVKHSADIHSEDNDGSSSRDICSSKWPFMQHEEEVK